MEGKTIDALQEILHDDHKQQILKHNNIIRALSTQEEILKKSIENKLTELAKIEINVQSLNKLVEDKIFKADEDIKVKNNEIEAHRKKVMETLDRVEKSLDLKKADITEKQNDLIKQSIEINSRKENFDKFKSTIIDLIQDHNRKIDDVIYQAVETIKGV